ncbi:MAG: glycosyltransferase family 4 protein [Anaerolineae bacterium]
MRVLYLTTDFGIPVFANKGAAVHVREMCNAFSRTGHAVLLVAPVRGDRRQALSADVRVLEPERRHARAAAEIRAAGGPHHLAEEVRSLMYAASLPRRLQALLADFRPELVYERHALFGGAGAVVARRLGIPHFLEVNAPLCHEQAAFRSLALPATAAAAEGEALAAADRVLCVSRGLADWAKSHNVAPDKLTVLPNAVAIDDFRPRPTSTASRGPLPHLGRAAPPSRWLQIAAPTLGFVGSLKPWHGTDQLLRAAASLGRAGRSVKVLVVGHGPERRSLAALAGELGIADATHFAGAVAHELVPPLLHLMDVAVAPYPAAPEGTAGFYFSPLKLFEYMAAALPVVAADAGQMREVVSQGTTGWLYEAGDSAALAAALAAVLGDEEEAVRVGAAAREYVVHNHSWRGNARRVIELARSVPRQGPVAA